MRKRSKPKRKRYVLVCTLLISASLVLMGSFAWFTKNSTILNIFKVNQLETKIVEHFIPPDDMRLGESIKKLVSVQNTGGASALVRVSLDEYLALFEIDNKTGNLLSIDNDGSEILDIDEPSTWSIGQLSRDRLDNKKFNKVREIKSGINIGDKSTTDCFDMTFPNVGRDWSYDKDSKYFYYTKILKNGEVTSAVLDVVRLSDELPNSYKGMEYDLVVNMDAIEATKDSLTSTWEINDKEILDKLTALFD